MRTRRGPRVTKFIARFMSKGIGIGQGDYFIAARLQRNNRSGRRAPGPDDGEVAVRDAQNAHQVHGARGHVHDDEFDVHVFEHAFNLTDSGIVGA